jgi:4-hydroxybenzoate polyprenyltransferase
VLKSIIKFARIRILITCFAIAFLGCLVTGSVTITVLAALLLIVAFIVHANSINDLADRHIDAINLQTANDRPLISGDISVSQLWFIHLFSGGFIIVLSTLIYGVKALLLSLLILFIDYIYSLQPLRITNRPIASPLLLAFAYVYFSFSIGFWSGSATASYPWLLTLGLYFGFIARLLLKDFRDIKGDKKFGKQTFLIRYGIAKTCIASIGLWVIAGIFISLATSLNLGVVLVVVYGIIVVSYWLVALSKTRSIDQQQWYVHYIAKAANCTILVLMTYVITQSRSDFSSFEKLVIPGACGLVLLSFSWLHYSVDKKA